MRPTAWLLLAAALLSGCRPQSQSADFVARVGNAMLLQSDLDTALEGIHAGLDTAYAKAQVINQWVENELLYQEALRLKLGLSEPVRQQLRDAERAVLIDALVAPLYAESCNNLTEQDLAAYYETYKERLSTLEPYVLVQFIEAVRRDSALTVQRLMRGAADEDAMTLFDSLLLRYAIDPELSRSLASNYWPESRLFTGRPRVRQAMQALTPSGDGRVFAADSLHFYLRVADRLPTGTVPELAWVEEQVRMHCAIDLRKQLYDRLVQRLRAEAVTRGTLAVKQ